MFSPAGRIGTAKCRSVKLPPVGEEESIPAMESESLQGPRESRLDDVNSELSTP